VPLTLVGKKREGGPRPDGNYTLCLSREANWRKQKRSKREAGIGKKEVVGDPLLRTLSHGEKEEKKGE